MSSVRCSAEVADALTEGRAVVALESTIFSSLGLPSPHNEKALHRCESAIRAAGAVPAMTAVLDGVAVAGVEAHQVDRVLGGTAKTSSRDLPVALGRRWPVGVTTVAGSLAIAHQVGIAVFATGGIGGVHRGSERTGDVSADLGALASYSVCTVTAGAKAFLDLGKTVEYLDTLGVPLLGYQTDYFPAFYSRSSGRSVQARVETASEVAAIIAAAREFGYRGGLVLGNPIPTEAEISEEEIEASLSSALEQVEQLQISGPGVTPFLLAAIAQATSGRSLPANLALAESNASLAAEVAVALAGH